MFDWKYFTNNCGAIYEKLTESQRDLLLMASDLDKIDTKKDWNELSNDMKADWTNWLLRDYNKAFNKGLEEALGANIK